MLSGGHVPSPNERHPPDGVVHWTTGTDLVLKIPSPVVPASGLGPAGGGGIRRIARLLVCADSSRLIVASCASSVT